MFCFKLYKMNETVNKFLLAGNKFMPELHLKQPGFTYSACCLYTKNKERIEKLTQSGNTDFIHRYKLDKACFQHDMAYGKLKDLAKRTQSDKGLSDKPFTIASNPNMMDTKEDQPRWLVYKFFDKKSSGGSIDAEPNYQLANELHMQNIRKLKIRKVYSSFRDNTWGVHLADMQSLGRYNKGIKYLLCAIDLFSKYAWVVPLKDKGGITIINAFQKIISKRKPNKMWVDQGGEFYNKLFKRFVKINNIEMYSTYSERQICCC